MMDDITAGVAPEGLFSKRSSSNILSDPRILEHLRIVAEEAQSSEKETEQDAESEFAVTKRELVEKITSYNKRNQLGAFRIILKEDLSFDGALRFYFEDGNEKLTKAVRLTSQTQVSELLPTLIEKFKPDLDQTTLVRRAKLYEVHDEFEREADEIYLDPSDCPLDIALNAKRPVRLVLRLEYDRPTESSESLPNGAPIQSDAHRNSLNSSQVSIHSNGSDHSSTSESTHVGRDSPRNSKPSHGKNTPASPPARTSSSSSDKSRNIFKNATSPRTALGMFFDGVGGGSGQQDRSAHHANKAARGKRQRKRSFGSLLNFKKNSAPKKNVELSTNTLAPGVLKVFGGHVSPGANYKSVRATELTIATEIVKEALERYSLKSHDSAEYVLCDVIGYFKGADGNTKTDAEHEPSENDSEQWITEYARVIGDKEKPLILQQLWKPITGFSRRFELRKRIETQDSTFFQTRGSIAVVKAANVREVKIPAAIQESQMPERSLGSFGHFESFGLAEGSSTARPSVVISPFLPPTDTPYLLLIRGYGIADDFLYHRLDEQMALIGAHARVINGNHSDHHPDIALFAPDIMEQHCMLSKKVETSGDLDMEECEVNFVVCLEPYRNALICINGVSITSPVKLTPGDLISLGNHYIYMFKDPTQVLDKELKLQWMDALQKFNDISKRFSRSVSDTDTISSEAGAQDVPEEGKGGITSRLSYKVEDEAALLEMILGVGDIKEDVYELTPAYLLLFAIEHSAAHHSDVQTRGLLLKISNSIQTVAWEKTSDMSNIIDKDTAPSRALSELLPQLRPVIYWMANSLEMLHFLQPTLSKYLGDVAEIAGSTTDEALLAADDEMLMCLEEVVMYSFQQTVYHLTKVLYVALPVILDTNPFQFDDEDDQDGKRPQEIDMVVNIFNSTHELVNQYNVHQDITRQLFAYLFFFANASLFNTLMERGAGGKFYRWAKGAQIRGNLDALEAWASQVGLQDEYTHYLTRLSTAADLLATPKVQLLQADWLTIRRDFPALNAAQVQQILGEYQLGAGKTRPRGWFPPPEEVEPALRTADILLSFVDHPPLALPTTGYVLDMKSGPDNETFYSHLAVAKESINSGLKNRIDWGNFKSLQRIQQPEPEISRAEQLPAYSSPDSLADIDDIDVPSVVVSPASPKPISDADKDRPYFDSDRTREKAQPPIAKVPSVTSSPLEGRPGRPVPAPRSPEMKRRSQDSHLAERAPSSRPSKFPQPAPRANKKESPLEKVRKPRPQARSSAGSTPEEMSPKGRNSAGSTPTRSPQGSFSGSRGRSGSAASSVSSLSSSGTRDGMRDENHNVSAMGGIRKESEPFIDDRTKWVEVNGTGVAEALNGLSVLPVEDNGEPEMTNGSDVTDEHLHEKVRFMSQLQRSESQRSVQSDDVTTGTDVEYKLEGMRDGDDAQDDVFIVELVRTADAGIGLGLIDGLYTPLRSPGIYVKTLVPGGPAMSDGRLRLGDRILAVNGTSLVGADHQSAMQQIRQAGDHLSFLVAKSDIHVAMKITASSC